jgi:3-hydroxyisobutyrate dehydrogenase-like beta-hydroxyacid dehydrogenase
MADVAIIGTGRMGAAMAGTLRRAGFAVTVFNRTSDKAEAVAKETGAAVAPTAREAAASADVVLSSLSDDAALRQAYGGEDGVHAGLQAGAVLLETSTVDPETVQAVRADVEARGAHLLDAPVSGSVPLVERGELMIMVGGEAGPLEKARPVLDALAKKVIHVGELGAGATMKLAVNGVVHALSAAVSEALVLAERAGVDRSAAYEVIASSAAAAPFVHYKRAAFEQPGETPVAFSLDLVAKDLDLILALGERVGAPLRQVAANRELVGLATGEGYGPQDMSALADFLRRSAPA